MLNISGAVLKTAATTATEEVVSPHSIQIYCWIMH